MTGTRVLLFVKPKMKPDGQVSQWSAEGVVERGKGGGRLRGKITSQAGFSSCFGQGSQRDQTNPETTSHDVTLDMARGRWVFHYQLSGYIQYTWIKACCR